LPKCAQKMMGQSDLVACGPDQVAYKQNLGGKKWKGTGGSQLVRTSRKKKSRGVGRRENLAERPGQKRHILQKPIFVYAREIRKKSRSYLGAREGPKGKKNFWTSKEAMLVPRWVGNRGLPSKFL